MGRIAKSMSLFVALLVGLMGPGFAQDSAKQDMKDAGHETKQAAKDTGHATKTAAKKTGHTVKEGHEEGDPQSRAEDRPGRAQGGRQNSSAVMLEISRPCEGAIMAAFRFC